MKLMMLILPVLLLAISVSVAILLVKRGRSPKRAMAVHFLSLIVIGTLCLCLPVAVSAEGDESASVAGTSASEEVGTPADQAASGMTDKSMAYIGAGLAVGVAAVGGGIAVASAAPAAIGATSEDPKNFGKSIIFVALGEGFGLYGLLIAIMMLIL